jgi:ABC-type bacteriocin/lantibiotic exporter with double-glycine peptidase domain
LAPAGGGWRLAAGQLPVSELRRRLGDTLTALTGVMPWSRQSLNAILVITASVLVSALISLVLPVATAWLYGTIIPQHAPDLLPWLFLILVAVAIASAASE